MLQKEIAAYNPEMLTYPSLVLLNKIDTDESSALMEDFFAHTKIAVQQLFKISALTGDGLPELVESITKIIKSSTN